MILLQGKEVELNHFPDGTLLIKQLTKEMGCQQEIILKWKYEADEELVAVYFLTKHIKAAGYENIVLDMPYIPNARQDRVKNPEDVFTLKYFAEIINSLGYKQVRVLDAHSNVSLALIDRIVNRSPAPYIKKIIQEIEHETGKMPLMFYPDEGAGKRYSGMIQGPYCFGIKKRDWETGEIKGLDIAGASELIPGRDILIVDDICSYGGTFLFSAQKLKESGANHIYLYVSHCETSILNGKLITSGLLKKIYTTDTIFHGKHELIEVMMEV